MLTIPVSLLITHFIADFILQNDWMALGKSKEWKPLLAHTLLYALCFLWLLSPLFIVVTFLTHTATDWVTSRINSKLWFVNLAERSFSNKNLKWPYFASVDTTKRHWFFVMIGFDQLIHYITLALTYRLLF